MAHLLITGATGKTGSHATTTLLGRGHQVRALVHRVDERSERLAEAGAEIVTGDLLDLDAVAKATQGIEAAYLTYPIAPGLIDATATLLQAAEENHVGALVNMSQISARRDAGSNAARQHWIAERVLDHFSGTVTHIRPTFFAEWLLHFRDETTGDLRLPFGEGRHAPIPAEDQGRLIAAILEDPAPHAGKIYPLYGPVELDHHQIARAVSETLGYPVRYVPVEIEEFQAQLERTGRSPHLIQHLSNVAIDYRNGIFAGTNDVIRTITGTEALTVEEFVERNRQQFDAHASHNR
ncbi:NAD(P)H-binding protein [Pseudonocardia spinosispora]|uniref:NmrA family NAD(P)-binding protein n=1 Tax=Pseudonocardia spinosispora TaxID=103441 RepID=UPI00041D8837|nr:NAD(P)H-binding protein [Pseudonocardia spinosispora]